MNRTYKLVWNAAQNMWVVAGELAKGRKKTSGKCLTFILLLVSSMGTFSAHAAPVANALPTGESVASGSATFDRSVTNQLTVNQSSAKLITNWNSFDVGSNGKVIFAQPDTASIALNRVTTGSPTEIFGQLNANGQLILVNPNGMSFGAGSQVSAAAVVASSLDILDSDFNLGNLIFTRGATAGAVSNAGSLQAKHIILLSPDIGNSGTLNAVDGNIGLINANQVNATTQGVIQSSSVAGVIKNSGTLQASKVTAGNGLVILFGDTSQSSSHVDMAGSISAADTNSVQGFNINVSNDLALVNTTNLVALGSINFNADVNMTGNGGLALTSLGGYNLNYGSKVNLAGVAPAFTVNGTAYTVISDVNQLQNMSLNLAGNYVLANNIDASVTAGWNAGMGFVPVGTVASAFTGNIEGLGHAVNALAILRPGMDSVGLIGYGQSANIRYLGVTNANIQGGSSTGGLMGVQGSDNLNVPMVLQGNWVSGSVIGHDNVGGLVGLFSNNFFAGSLISGNYVDAMVQGNNGTGGLIGSTVVTVLAAPTPANITISNNYVANSVQGLTNTGGLIGQSQFNELIGNNSVYTIQDNLVSAAMTGTTSVTGGLIGNNMVSSPNFGSSTFKLNRNYVNGPVTGVAAGGLIGQSNVAFGFTSPFNSNFWNIQTTGQAAAIGSQVGIPVLTGYTGISVLQAMQLATFTSWGSNIDAAAGTGSTWRIYDGLSGPLLRSFLKPLTISADETRTYDGIGFSAPTLAYSRSSIDFGKLQGAAVASGAALGVKNVGSYSFSLSGLYSTDTLGYDIGFAASTLNISKADLYISTANVTKTFDGTNSASGTAVAANATQLFGTDTLSGGSFAFDNKNAGTGKTVTVSGVTVNDGNSGNNYNLLGYVDNTNSTINKADISISSTDVIKTYDASTSANGSAVVTAGSLFGSDSMSGGSFAFADKNAGTGKHVTVSGVTVNDGNNGGNYNVTYADNTSSSINKRLLTLTAIDASKVYDGKLTSADKPLITGRQRGDSIVGLTQSYLDKNAGTGKTIQVDSGYTIRDGNNGNNYTVMLVDSHNGLITPKAISISTVANTKTYDGGVTSANKPVVTGLLTGDRITGLFQQYETKTVGTGKKMLIKSGYVVQDGNSGNNYSVTEQGSMDGVINP